MERTHVESSQIESVGYDPATKVLEVEFVAKKDGTPGAIYQYENVPQEIHDQLVAAQSVGRYFNQFVKYGFTYHKLGEAPRADLPGGSAVGGRTEQSAPEGSDEPGPPNAA